MIAYELNILFVLLLPIYTHLYHLVISVYRCMSPDNVLFLIAAVSGLDVVPPHG